MYSFSPKKTNKIAEGLSVCLFSFAAVLLVITSRLDLPYFGLIEGIAVALLVAALAVLSRYTFKSFTYSVQERDGEGLDLIITERQGKRRFAVCRIALSGIEEIIVPDENNKDVLKKKRAGRKVFAYYVEIKPQSECYVFTTECGEPLLIKLSPDEKLLISSL